MYKIIPLVIIGFLTACSPKPSSKQAIESSPEKTFPIEMHLDSLTAQIKEDSLLVDSEGVNFGSIPHKVIAKVSLIITNTTSSSKTVELSILNLSPIESSSNCPEILAPKKSCTVNFSLDSNSLTVGTEIAKAISLNSVSIPVQAQIAAPLISDDQLVVLNPEQLSLGSVEQEKIIKRKLRVFNPAPANQDPQLEQNTLDKISLNSNCSSEVKSRRTCQIELSLNTAEINPSSLSESFKLQGTSYPVTAQVIPAQQETLEITPSISSFDLGSFSSPSVKNFSVTFLNLDGRDFSNFTIETQAPVQIKSTGCSASIGTKRSCVVNFETTLIGNWASGSRTESLKIVSGNKASQSVALSLVVTPPVASASDFKINNDNLFTNSVNVIAAINVIAPEMKISSNNSCSGGTWENSVSSKPLTLTTNQTSSYSIQFRNGINNNSSCITKSITHDDISPVISISQTNPIILTEGIIPRIFNFNASIVELNPQSSFSYSVYSNATCEGAAQDYSLSEGTTILPVELTQEGDVRTIKITVTDKAGNSTTSGCSPSVSLAVSPVASVNSFIINNNDLYTNNSTVTASISAQNAAEMKISPNATCSGGSYEAYAASKILAISTLNTLNHYSIKFKNGPVESDCFSKSITHDNILPVISFGQVVDVELDSTNAAANHSFLYTFDEVNPPTQYQSEVFNTMNCSGSPISVSASVPYSQGYTTTLFNKGEYRTVKITVTDKAGNTTSSCSKYVTFGQPDSISVPLFSSLQKIYETPKSFSGVVKDKYGNNLENISVQVNSGSENKTLTTDAAGAFSFGVSSQTNYSAGLKVGALNSSITALVANKPSVTTSGSISVLRRSCQELAVKDTLSISNNYTIDPDLDSNSVSNYGISITPSGWVNRTVSNSNIFTPLTGFEAGATYLVEVDVWSVSNGGNVELLITGNGAPYYDVMSSTLGRTVKEYTIPANATAVDLTIETASGRQISYAGLSFRKKLSPTSLAETSVYCNFSNGIDLETPPHTTITNREKISRSLKTVMGLERIYIPGITLSGTETGPSNLTVYKPSNNEPRVRFVGSWKYNNDNVGGYAQVGTPQVPAQAGIEFVEVSFYGTGLNLITLQNNFARDVRVSIDGGSEGSNIMVGASGDDIYNQLYYRANNITNVARKLTLGWHTAKLRVMNTNGVQVYGFEILNQRSDILTYPGGIFDGVNLAGIMTPTTSSMVSGLDLAYGGRVIKYVEENQVKTATRQVDSAPKYWTNADHSNEEVAKTLHFRDFGSNQTSLTGFNTIGTTVVDRYYAMDDGLALFGNSVAVAGGELYGSNTGSYMNFTFTGSGVDIHLGNISSSNSVTLNIYVDNVLIASPTFSGATSASLYKIASGLPYGTHHVTINRASGVSTNSFSLTNFIVYQPKKPVLPVNAKIVDDYNVLTSFVSTTAVANSIPKGIIRKNPLKEFTYVNGGTGASEWTLAAGNSYFNYVEMYSNKAGAYFEFSFFGTGFNWRGYSASNSSTNITVSINGVTYTGAASTLGGPTWTPATGTLSLYNATINPSASFVVNNLPLDFYTVRFTNNNGSSSGDSYLRVSAIDVITPFDRSNAASP